MDVRYNKFFTFFWWSYPIIFNYSCCKAFQKLANLIFSQVTVDSIQEPKVGTVFNPRSLIKALTDLIHKHSDFRQAYSEAVNNNHTHCDQWVVVRVKYPSVRHVPSHLLIASGIIKWEYVCLCLGLVDSLNSELFWLIYIKYLPFLCLSLITYYMSWTSEPVVLSIDFL